MTLAFQMQINANCVLSIYTTYAEIFGHYLPNEKTSAKQRNEYGDFTAAQSFKNITLVTYHCVLEHFGELSQTSDPPRILVTPPHRINKYTLMSHAKTWTWYLFSGVVIRSVCSVQGGHPEGDIDNQFELIDNYSKFMFIDRVRGLFYYDVKQDNAADGGERGAD
ncbi:hypothetical protein B0J17DRAFT_628469 [Rhizoctonia solani]|nr:hypothetical protein B0J17DRAFT_628469 [Rhizoctonia solani]